MFPGYLRAKAPVYRMATKKPIYIQNFTGVKGLIQKSVTKPVFKKKK